MSRKLTGAYLEGRCRLAGITGGWHLKDREIERRLANGGDWLAPPGRPGATAQHPPARSSLHLSPREHAEQHLSPQRHSNLSFLSRYVQCFRVESRRPASWNGAAATGTRVLGRRATVPRTAAERRLADGAVAPERRGAAGQHVAQQVNTYRTTARRQHLAQGPATTAAGTTAAGTTAAGTAGAEPGPGGWGLAARGSARTVAGRLAPGLAAGRTGDAGRQLAEGPGSQGAGAAGGGWRGWRRGLAGGGWGGGAAGRRGGRATGRPGDGAAGRRGGGVGGAGG